MYVRTYVCMYVCTYVSMYVCVYVCMYVGMCVCKYYVCVYVLHMCVCCNNERTVACSRSVLTCFDDSAGIHGFSSCTALNILYWPRRLWVFHRS